MRFTWVFEKEQPQQIKYFLKEKGVSKGLFAKIKFRGGNILVNDEVQNARFYLTNGDNITIEIPAEGEHETVVPDDTGLDIVYEDEHLLIVNKPSGVASIPAQYHPVGTMVNRVKYHYCAQDYDDRVVHVVTRLDRDTSGLMLFARHGFAHARLDQQLRKKQIIKCYQALVSDPCDSLKTHDIICSPIGRDTSSLIKRQVTIEGKEAITEYWLNKRTADYSLVDIKLHTGRTHQIRVHFDSLGCPLLGDDLYGGVLDAGVSRQALHCRSLSLQHPFTGETLHFEQPLPEDMRKIIDKKNE
ncbi:RluA family pseudouridine synthase [Vagococcus entomophilus]|uniref:Pseudouridine synthase n=1 Tax=Vagococcus entomophilus TaxID=1160095 RepID=A0A430ALB7_9ENTE|nr:RluA family pseudouridine synthase [Vagococcus entomophilus]RSU08723.1 RNA pseudouridine synthase [Vagococcus entomophilus]